jgi:hypothetical protein
MELDLLYSAPISAPVFFVFVFLSGPEVLPTKAALYICWDSQVVRALLLHIDRHQRQKLKHKTQSSFIHREEKGKAA